MRLRAIGGPRNGEWIEVRDDIREGDAVQVSVMPPAAVLDPFLDIEAESQIFHVARYRMFGVTFNNTASYERERHEVLVHDSMNLFDAISYALSEWGPKEATEEEEVEEPVETDPSVFDIRPVTPQEFMAHIASMSNQPAVLRCFDEQTADAVRYGTSVGRVSASDQGEVTATPLTATPVSAADIALLREELRADMAQRLAEMEHHVRQSMRAERDVEERQRARIAGGQRIIPPPDRPGQPPDERVARLADWAQESGDRLRRIVEHDPHLAARVVELLARRRGRERDLP